jgi:hypothetical protein
LGTNTNLTREKPLNCLKVLMCCAPNAARLN